MFYFQTQDFIPTESYTVSMSFENVRVNIKISTPKKLKLTFTYKPMTRILKC